MNERKNKFCLPPYSEQDLAEFEAVNGITLPLELRNYLANVSMSVTKKSGYNFVIDLYEDDPLMTASWKHPSGYWVNGTFFYKIHDDHPLYPIATTVKNNTFHRVMTMVEYDFHVAQTALEVLKSAKKRFKYIPLDKDGERLLKIGDNGCGMEDYFCLQTKKIHFRDYHFDTCCWFWKELDSFNEYLKFNIGLTGEKTDKVKVLVDKEDEDSEEEEMT